MKTEVRVINKEIAQEMLKKNYNNRRVSKSNVNFLSKQMKEGQWLFDAQPIRFDEFGRLLDGQHRLSAVVESETEQEFLIITGVNSKAFKVMDTGKSRSGGDALSMIGCKYPTTVSAVAKMIIKHNRGSHSRDSGGEAKVTNSEIVKWYEDNKNIEDVIRGMDKPYKSFSRVLPHSYLVFLFEVFAKKDVIAAEKFIGDLCYGRESNLKHPSNVLRRMLINNKISKSTWSSTYKMSLIFKAWNAFRKGKEVSHLRIQAGEKFPVII